MMLLIRFRWAVALGLAAWLCVTPASAAAAKPRLIILTDIGGDPDDQQSMVRLMTYSNEFDIEGLIASASGTPNELKQQIVKPELIKAIVEAYGKVQPNLARHAEGYPAVQSLLGVIKSGDPKRDVSNIGAKSDTEGSRWIISVVDRPDPRPMNVSIFGGAHDLAQALWRVRNDRTSEQVDRFVAKLRVHSITHQDNTGPWIVQNFPNLFFILSSVDASEVLGSTVGKIDKRQSVFRGMYLGGDESLTSLEWVDRNVRVNHGPLGALYPPKTSTAPNPHRALKEGDTPSWFYFLPNGLSDPEYPEWGGWGGRFRLVRNRYYNDAQDQVGETKDGRATVWRWREAYQNDFEARMDWCANSQRAQTNHAPAAVLNGDRSRGVVRLSVPSGGVISLTAKGSADPDRQAITWRWFHYPEPGGQEKAMDLGAAAKESISFKAPEVDSVVELHIVLEVIDSGKPALRAYRRAVVKVTPKHN